MFVVNLVEDRAVLVRRVAERDATIASLRTALATLEGTIAAFQSSLINHANEVQLLRRRLYGAKSERGGTSELQLLLGKFLDDKAELTAALEKLLDEAAAATGEVPPSADAVYTVSAGRMTGVTRWRQSPLEMPSFGSSSCPGTSTNPSGRRSSPFRPTAARGSS